MSKPKPVVSLAIALVTLVAAGWWAAKTLRLVAPAAYSMEMIAYGVPQQTAGGPAIALRLGEGDHAPGRDKIKGPVPVSMPAPPLAKKNKFKGDVEALLDVDASGSVAGVREIYSNGVSSAGLANTVLDIAHTWKFEPATEKGKPVPATVIVQVRF